MRECPANLDISIVTYHLDLYGHPTIRKVVATGKISANGTYQVNGVECDVKRGGRVVVEDRLTGKALAGGAYN